MAINKKLIHFKTKAAYNREKEAGNILDTSIVYVKDAKKIYTHGEEYNGDSYTKNEINTLINLINTNITTEVNTLTQSINTVDSKFINYQPSLTAGEGIKIENNTISSTLDTSLIRIVTSLPTAGIEINKIYVVPNSSGEDNNIYNEYIYVNGIWEKVGSFSSSTSTGKRKVEITVPINSDGNLQPQLVTEQMMKDLNDVYENKTAELYLSIVNLINSSLSQIYVSYNPLSLKQINGDNDITYILVMNNQELVFRKDQNITISNSN